MAGHKNSNMSTKISDEVNRGVEPQIKKIDEYQGGNTDGAKLLELVRELNRVDSEINEYKKRYEEVQNGVNLVFYEQGYYYRLLLYKKELKKQIKELQKNA